MDYQVGPKSKDKCPPKRHTEEKTEMRRKDVARETVIGMMRPQVKEHLKPRKAGRDKKQNLPYSLGREHSPTGMLISDLWPPEL